MPTITRKDLSDCHLHLTVSLSKDEILPKVKTELKKFKTKANIPGFRRGQAPDMYLKKMYGPSVFYDVFTKMMSENLVEYMHESKLDVLGQPLPAADENKEELSFNVDKPSETYTTVYDIGIVPEFEIKGIDQSFSYERYAIEDLETIAREDLENMRQQAAERFTPEGPIEENDILWLDIKELENGAPKADGYENKIMILVSSIQDEAVRNVVVGGNAGASFNFKPSTLEGERSEDFIRKYILKLEDDRQVSDEFQATISDVMRSKPAELTEEFFQNNISPEVSTEAEAIAHLSKAVDAYYTGRANQIVFREIYDRLPELNPFNLPVAFLKRWLQVTAENPITEEEIERDFALFEKDLRWQVLRDRMIAQFNIDVTEDEIRQEFANSFRQYFRYGLPEQYVQESVSRMMRDKKEVERTFKNIQFYKMMDAVVNNVTIKPVSISAKEFQEKYDALVKLTNNASEE